MTQDLDGSAQHLHVSMRTRGAIRIAPPSLFFLLGFLCVGLTSPAAAKVCEFIDGPEAISPPADFREDSNLEDKKRVRVLSERKAVQMSGGVTANEDAYGTHHADELGSTPFIAGGTFVDSDYFHFDPNVLNLVTGNLRFCRPILGVIGRQSDLLSSRPVLGSTSSSVTYPDSDDFEGIEGKKNDWFRIYKIGGEKVGLEYSFRAKGGLDFDGEGGVDNLRVITEPTLPGQ